MATNLHFSKSDPNTPWGFRLAGGAECDVPLTVVKVAEGSIAENVGLKVGDVVITINDYNVEKLTHAEAHDVLINGGLEVTFVIYRDNELVNGIDDRPVSDTILNIEHESIQEEISTNLPSDEVNITVKPSIPDKIKDYTQVTDDEIAEVISGETELLPEQNVLGVNFNKVDLTDSTVLKALGDAALDTTIDLQTKKWSTFLQKPKRSVVKPKSLEQEKPKAPPYRVLITKQKKNIMEETENLINNTVQLEEFCKSDDTNSVDDVEDPCVNKEDINDTESVASSEKEPEVNDIDDMGSNNSLCESTEHEEELNNNNTETITSTDTLTLEDQLAQVQEQLQALSKLPSTIQVTLDAVTQQLAKIVKATHKRVEGLQETEPNEEFISDDDELVETVTEEEIDQSSENNEEVAAENSDLEDEIKFDQFSDILEDDEEHKDVCSGDSEADDTQENLETDLKDSLEEELKLKQIEEDKVAQQERLDEFHQRRLEQRPTHPLTPLQRPIVLPGGRRWSQPNDALPTTTRKFKMSDEKISETIETHSEVLSGRTKGYAPIFTVLLKGCSFQVNHWNALWPWSNTTKPVYRINFLKYQPPPKNLDYLQRSEVFKLIHDMDPPNRGIAARPGKVPSVEDYYTQEPYQDDQPSGIRV